jgi:hypothetical protein
VRARFAILPRCAVGRGHGPGLRAIAEDGVDCISIGALTKHVHAIDLSMKLGPPPGDSKARLKE